MVPMAALFLTCAPPLVFGTTSGFNMTYGCRLPVMFRLPCESNVRPESPGHVSGPNPTNCRRIDIPPSSSFNLQCRLPNLYRRDTYRSDDDNLVFNHSHLNQDSRTNVEMHSSLAPSFSKFEQGISHLRHTSCLRHQTMISSNVVNFGLALSMPGLALDLASTYDHVICDETIAASVEYYWEFPYGFSHAPDSRAVHIHGIDLSNSRLIVLTSESQFSYGGIFFHNLVSCFAEIDFQFQYDQDSSEFSVSATLQCLDLEFTYNVGIFNHFQSSSVACDMAWQCKLTYSCFNVAAVLCIYPGHSYDAIFFDYLNLFWITTVERFQYDAVTLSLVMLTSERSSPYEADIFCYFESCSSVSVPELPYSLDCSVPGSQYSPNVFISAILLVSFASELQPCSVASVPRFKDKRCFVLPTSPVTMALELKSSYVSGCFCNLNSSLIRLNQDFNKDYTAVSPQCQRSCALTPKSSYLAVVFHISQSWWLAFSRGFQYGLIMQDGGQGALHEFGSIVNWEISQMSLPSHALESPHELATHLSMLAFKPESTQDLRCTFLDGHCCSLLVKVLAVIMLCYSMAYCKPRTDGVKLLRIFCHVQNRCQFFTIIVLCWLCFLNSHTVHGTAMADTIPKLQRTPELTLSSGHDATQFFTQLTALARMPSVSNHTLAEWPEANSWLPLARSHAMGLLTSVGPPEVDRAMR
eukprot:SAG31_NODE_6130_length_2156_cov_2.234322_1_plen_694_part_01